MARLFVKEIEYLLKDGSASLKSTIFDKTVLFGVAGEKEKQHSTRARLYAFSIL